MRAELQPPVGEPCGQCGGDGYLSDDAMCLGCAGTGKAKDATVGGTPEPERCCVCKKSESDAREDDGDWTECDTCRQRVCPEHWERTSGGPDCDLVCSNCAIPAPEPPAAPTPAEGYWTPERLAAEHAKQHGAPAAPTEPAPDHVIAALAAAARGSHIMDDAEEADTLRALVVRARQQWDGVLAKLATPAAAPLGAGPGPSEALASMRAVMTTSARDWATNKGDAWLYGIVVGWDAHALSELAEAHDWDAGMLLRLGRLHHALHHAAPSAPQAETPDEQADEMRLYVDGENLDIKRVRRNTRTLLRTIDAQAERIRLLESKASAPQGGPADKRERCGCIMGARWVCVEHCGGHGIPKMTPLPATPPHGERPSVHTLQAAAHADGARQALRAVKRGRTPEDVERDYPIGPECFGGQDYPPDDTTRPSMAVMSPESIDAALAEPAYVPRVGEWAVPWREFGDDEFPRLGWEDEMSECLGRPGRVVEVDDDGDVHMWHDNAQWFWPPQVLRPHVRPTSDEPGSEGAIARANERWSAVLLGATVTGVDARANTLAVRGLDGIERVMQLGAFEQEVE